MKDAGVRLKLVEQETLASQDTSGGKLYLCVKNGPISCKLGGSVDFSRSPVVATLYYEDMQHEVATVKSAPLVFKSNVVEDGAACNVDCRIKVLSSQHDDSNFRILFRALDGSTGKPYEPDAVAWSGPIKVVSKPEQIADLAGGGVGGAKKEAGEKPQRAQRVRYEYAEQLERVRDTAREQLHMLERLVRKKEEELVSQGREYEVIAPANAFLLPPPPPPPPSASSLSSNVSSSAAAASQRKKRGRKEEQEDKEVDDDDEFDYGNAKGRTKRTRAAKGSKRAQAGAAEEDQQGALAVPEGFDGAFFRFVTAFNDLDAAAKAEQLRACIRKLRAPRSALWKTFLDSVQSEIASTAQSKANSNSGVDFCQCPACPYRQKVLNFDLIFGGIGGL